MILLLVVAVYALAWLLIAGMVLTALAALLPVLIVLFLFSLIRALVRPRGDSR